MFLLINSQNHLARYKAWERQFSIPLALFEHAHCYTQYQCCCECRTVVLAPEQAWVLPVSN